MDIRKIKKLIDLIDETGVSEIEIKEGEESVRISRQFSRQMPYMMPTMPVAPQPVVPRVEEEHAAKKVHHNEEAHGDKSPMVGTVYLSASPGADPFVKLGQRVEAGAILCLIE